MAMSWDDETNQGNLNLMESEDEIFFQTFVNDLFQNFSPFSDSTEIRHSSFIDSCGNVQTATVQTAVLSTQGVSMCEALPVGDIPMVDTRISVSDTTDQQREKLIKAFPSSVPETNSSSSSASKSKKRNISLLNGLLKKTSTMKSPSVIIARNQSTTPSTRKDEEKHEGDELLRPFVAPLIKSLTKELSPVLSESGIDSSSFAANLSSVASEGQYTVHNKEDLSKRWENYAVERQEEIEDEGARAAVEYAIGVISDICNGMPSNFSVGPIASRIPSQVSAATLEEICNQGNANDYKLLYGISKRKDPEMLEIGCNMFSRLYHQVSLSLDSFAIDPEDVRSEPIIVSFGKTEVVGSTLGADGITREKKNCRAIFPTSPTDYFKKCFLFSDLCDRLQSECPVYGPGFSAARGCDEKVTKLLNRVTGGKGVSTKMFMGKQINIINRDMKHWDANMKEHMIEYGMKLLESLVDKSNLGPADEETRKVIFDLACDEVLTKLVEHPSGFLTWVCGTLPSGTYVTSTLNSICNAVLCVACPIYIATCIRKTCKIEELSSQRRSEIVRIAEQSIVCNGDNQLGTDELYTYLGIDFEPSTDNIFFSKVGMKVKVDECGSTPHLSKCMFSSRKFLRVKGDLFGVRPVESVLRKMYAKPFQSILDAKLYIRAMMVDYLAIDPIIFRCLSDIDRKLQVDPSEFASKLSRSGESFMEYVRSSLGVDSLGDSEIEYVKELLTSETPDRKSIMTLLVPRTDIFGMYDDNDRKVVAAGLLTGGAIGSDGITDNLLMACHSRPSISALANVSCAEWKKMLIKTGQVHLYMEMDDLSRLINKT